MIELRHLRYFVAVAEELHFGRAAARLHIAQPGLSQQIQALEREVGASLLDRTNRRVELTSAGRTLLGEARRLLAEVNRVVDLTRRAGAGALGRLVIGAAESASYAVLPPILRAYRRLRPDVELDVRELPSPAQVEALRRGELDVGFIRTPLDVSGLEVHPLTEEGLAVVLPADHPLARRARVPLAALAGEPLIVHPAGPRPNWSDFMIGLYRAAGVEPLVRQTADESTTAMSFVAAGLGVTLVPDSLVALRRPGTVARPLAGRIPTTRLALVHRPDHRREVLDPLVALALAPSTARGPGGRRAGALRDSTGRRGRPGGRRARSISRRRATGSARRAGRRRWLLD